MSVKTASNIFKYIINSISLITLQCKLKSTKKEKSVEEGQKELTEEEKTAPHSVPDKKRVKVKNEGVSGH